MKVNKQNTNYGHRLLMIFIIILSIFQMPSILANDNNKQEETDLKQILSSQSDPETLIPVLRRLAKLNEMAPIRVYYLEKQYELATQIDSYQDVYDALENLSNYYYNCLDQQDSLLYWNQVIDSIASKRNEYPNALFTSRAYSCKDLIWKKNYEVALTIAEELYRLASEEQQIIGLIASSECLGLIYRSVSQDNDAVAAYEIGLNQLKNITPGQYKQLGVDKSRILDTQLRLTGLQFESSYRAGQYEQAEEIAQKYFALIQEQELHNKNTGDNYPVEREYWLFYSLCIDLYTREQKLYKAKEAMQNADKYDGNIFAEGDYVELTNWFSKASYYKAKKDIPLAHHYIDKILKRERIPDELQLKADIWKMEGRLEEVLDLYEEIFQYDLKKNNETFLRQVNQLRTLHEINMHNAQKSELDYANKMIVHKKNQVLIVFFIIVVLLASLYILYRFIRRTQRLRNELLHEKESLLESEVRLTQEKDKAEEASRMKSTFVANMSHEIRTPLNAIVGFSGLLINEEAEPDEKEEYSQIIKNNTELLLTLINDVLDLSRMETGDMAFHMDYYPLYDCCQKALDSIRHRISGDVRLTFSPDPHPIMVYTDKLRIQQLLTNLLTNSAKFTSQGEINLSFRIEPDGKNARIAVTDTGCGIPLELQANIFKRFEKLDDYKPGAGLGLSICSIIAERVGGSIYIDSSYTGGARFVFIHPCEAPAEG